VAAGVDMKAWLTVGDDAVRDAHSECEAAGPIPIHSLFPNGLNYPGDPSGPAAETINCRCVLEPEFSPATLDVFFGKPEKHLNGAASKNRVGALV
jgi:hypothetical protein